MKKNELIDDKYELIVKEFQTVLSVFYLLLVGIGMLFSYSKYSKFGINIFQYSDIFDFLLTPFRDITIFVFSFVTVFVVYLVFKLDKLTKNKLPKFHNSKFHIGLMKSKPVVSVVLLFLLYLFIFSGKYGEMNKKRILTNPNIIEIVLANGKNIKGNLIGKNNGYVFLLEKENEVNIYPISNSINIIKLK